MRRRALVIGSMTMALLPSVASRAAGANAVAAVGTRCGYPHLGFSDGKHRWIVTSTVHIMPEAARDIRLVFGNIAAVPGNRETPGANPLILRVQVDHPGGKAIPVNFGGREQIKIEGGAFVTTDPLDVRLDKGAKLVVRNTVIVEEAPYKWPQNIVTCPPAGDTIAVGTDPTTMQAEHQPAGLHNRQGPGYGPFNILGRPERPAASVAILGDSVVASTGAADQYGDRNLVEFALNTQVAWCNLAIPSDGLGRFLAKNTYQLAMIDHNFTHAICALGIDDVRNGNEDRIRKNFLAVWNILTGMGLKVFQTTITTQTTSTDQWTTVQGQVIANPNFLPGGIYHRVNAWLRTVPKPLTGIFDPAALLETSLDSAIWIAPNHKAVTADGPHLDALGVQIGMKSINVQRLRR